MKINRFGEFFQDESGVYSSTRLAFLGTVFSVLAMWIVDCWHQKKLTPIDNSLIYLIGILMVGKVGQSFSENAPPK